MPLRQNNLITIPMAQIIYGRNPIEEAINEGVRMEKIFLLQTVTGPYEKLVRNYCQEHRIPLAKVPAIKLDKLTRQQNHQGVVGIMPAIEYHDISKACAINTEAPRVVILENITDVRNVGAIARSALAFDFQAMIVVGGKSAPINEDAIKASAGALLKLPVCRGKNVMVVIEELQQLGYAVYTTSLKTNDNFDSIDQSVPVAIIMGAEDKGVSYDSIKLADGNVKIAQSTQMESLNVSVAAGIAMYELFHKKGIE